MITRWFEPSPTPSLDLAPVLTSIDELQISMVYGLGLVILCLVAILVFALARPR